MLPLVRATAMLPLVRVQSIAAKVAFSMGSPATPSSRLTSEWQTAITCDGNVVVYSGGSILW